jgi:hypothetical protein
MPEGVVLFDNNGNAVGTAGNPLATTSTSTPVTGGTPAAQDDVAVDNTAGGVTVLAAAAQRKSALIQNTGAANMRVTYDGTAPTATHGFQLAPGATMRLSGPYCPTAAVLAIREGAVSTTAAREQTT